MHFNEVLQEVTKLRKRRRIAHEPIAVTVDNFVIAARIVALAALQKETSIKRLVHEIARTVVELAHLLAAVSAKHPNTPVKVSVDEVLETALREHRSRAHSGRIPDYQDRVEDISSKRKVVSDTKINNEEVS